MIIIATYSTDAGHMKEKQTTRLLGQLYLLAE